MFEGGTQEGVDNARSLVSRFVFELRDRGGFSRQAKRRATLAGSLLGIPNKTYMCAPFFESAFSGRA